MLKFIDLKITPAGGAFPYKRPESGMLFRQVAFSDLLKEVKDHCKANGFPIGPNFEAEVEDNSCRQLLQLFPNYTGCVTEEGMSAGPSGRNITLQDILKFLHFILKWALAGGKFVDQDEAERRSKICLKCPMHIDSAACMGCNGVSALIRKIKGNRHVSQEVNMRFCGACLCELKTKIWVPVEPMKRDDVEWSETCWMKDGN